MTDEPENENLRDIIKRILDELNPKDPALVEKVIWACEKGVNVKLKCYSPLQGYYEAVGSVSNRIASFCGYIPDGLTLKTVNYEGDYIPYNEIVDFRVMCTT